MVGAANVLGTVLSAVLIPHSGKKRLLMSSHLVMCLSMLLLAIGAALHKDTSAPSNTAFMNRTSAGGSDSGSGSGMGGGHGRGVQSLFFLSSSAASSSSSSDAYYPFSPLPLAILFVLGFALGSGPIPWVLCSEILPNSIKVIKVS